MPIPWLSLIDVALGINDVVRRVKGGTGVSTPQRAQSASSTPTRGGRDTRLAGVMMSALKEAFDRDHVRHELERQRAEDERQRADEERQRAERAMRLELLRQAGDRELGRMRTVLIASTASLLGSILLMTRLSAGTGVRVTLGLGCLLLLAAVAQSFAEQGRVGRLLASGDDRLDPERLTRGNQTLALGSMLAGLALVAVAALIV